MINNINLRGWNVHLNVLFSDHYRLLLRKERRRFLKPSTKPLLQTKILISTHMRKQLYLYISYCTFNGFSSFTHPLTYFSRNELTYQKFLGTRKSSDNKQKKYFYLSPKSCKVVSTILSKLKLTKM